MDLLWYSFWNWLFSFLERFHVVWLHSLIYPFLLLFQVTLTLLGTSLRSLTCFFIWHLLHRRSWRTCPFRIEGIVDRIVQLRDGWIGHQLLRGRHRGGQRSSGRHWICRRLKKKLKSWKLKVKKRKFFLKKIKGNQGGHSFKQS